MKLMLSSGPVVIGVRHGVEAASEQDANMNRRLTEVWLKSADACTKDDRALARGIAVVGRNRRSRKQREDIACLKRQIAMLKRQLRRLVPDNFEKRQGRKVAALHLLADAKAQGVALSKEDSAAIVKAICPEFRTKKQRKRS